MSLCRFDDRNLFGYAFLTCFDICSLGMLALRVLKGRELICLSMVWFISSMVYAFAGPCNKPRRLAKDALLNMIRPLAFSINATL